MNRGYRAGVNTAKVLVEHINLTYQCNTAKSFIEGFIKTFYIEMKQNMNMRTPSAKKTKPIVIEEIFREVLQEGDETNVD